ncbi:MAG: hypothetical protein HRT71_07735 [Flavobacteriales bacterium]|nr:hypothetical protein [Flavobacteriales bacterium]
MNNWILYFLEANACLVLLYGLYQIMAYKSPFFKLNRVLLLVIIGAALIVPLANIQFESSNAVVVNAFEKIKAIESGVMDFGAEDKPPVESVIDLTYTAPTTSWSEMLLYLALGGSIL